MRRAWRVGGLLLLGVVLAACAGPIEGPLRPAPGEPSRPVYVVDHGWHTGIVVRRQDVPDGVWPERRDFSRFEHVEVGWGDQDFYMAPEGTFWLALKAVFWPTPGVLHVTGFDGPVEAFFPHREIVELRVSERGLRALALFVQDAYARDATGQIVPLGPGQHASSRFYAARENYFLLKTCNTWTARALRSAGLPISPSSAVTAAGLMDQARPLGTARP
jgi:uncharacterized protein (TIGR02117 family)